MTTATAPDRVWTVPNALSLLRLLGVPLFLYLVLGPHEDAWAVWILIFAGISDYADGKIARRFNQFSRLGAVLDAVRMEERHAGRVLAAAGAPEYFDDRDALAVALDQASGPKPTIR